jgi:hypothetical protein
MDAKRGYYSLIQFCPDSSRLEAVNVGVLLFCPEARFLAARTAAGNHRAAKLVGRDGLDKAALNSAKRAIERRLEVDREFFQTLEDLQRFVATRGNVLKLTAPRPMKVFDPQHDLEALFAELVGGRPRAEASKPAVPELDQVFRRLQEQGRARLDWSLQVPLLGRTLRVPYAYRNGAWKLVKPQRFSEHENVATNTAMGLAVEGDLLQRHGCDEDGQKQLIVVSLVADQGPSSCVINRVADLLSEYGIGFVRPQELPGFISRVEQEAHA